jgi:hypothetical protein
MGYGPAVTRSQREEEESLREEYRRNDWWSPIVGVLI